MLENNIELWYNKEKNGVGKKVMHKIISSYLKHFCQDNVIETSDEKAFEYFVNYCVAYSAYPSNIDFTEITSDEDDCGIDGIIFIIDGELISTIEEARNIFSKPKKNIEVEVFFVQSKTSESYDRGEILKFGDGVKDFLNDDTNLPQGDFIVNAKKIFNCIIDNVSKIQNGRPNSHLMYVCTSNNDVATEIEATRKNILKNIEDTEYFYDVTFKLLGLKEIMKLWDNINNPTVAVLPVKQSAPYPSMTGVTEAYISIVAIRDYIDNVLMGTDGRMKLNIYEENVRAFLGSENLVNQKIRQTLLDPKRKDKFAIFNNGITIISPNVKVQNDRISMENYQIVNGCQTSNMLFECRKYIDHNAMLTVKIIEATDPDVIADIVKATNSQSKVDDSQFLSFSPFVRRLEEYFDATEDKPDKEIKLYFERRIGQYKNMDVPQKKVFTISETCRAVGAIFFNVPDMAGRYPTKFLAQMQDKLFASQNKEQAFYTAAVVAYKFKQLSTKGKLLNKYVIYKWHILTIFGYVVCGSTPPSLKKKKEIEKYCQQIMNVCMSDEECIKAFQKAVDVINEIGLKNSRDEVRSSAYANDVKKYCNTKLIVEEKK